MSHCAAKLQLWNKYTFQQLKISLECLHKQLGTLKFASSSQDIITRSNDIKRRINILLENEEIMWRQRSRVEWLKYGDRNTNFFHHYATNQRKRNLICGVKDSAGVWIDDQAVFSGLFVEHFNTLFCTQGSIMHEDSIFGVQGRVTA